MPSLESKILGSLASALIGDAMGSATENLSQEAIRENFGGRVETFCPPPPGTFAEGRKAGELTDDSTQLLEMVEAYIEGDGEIDIHRVAEHLMIWGAKEELAGRFSGPTTRNALKRLREGESPAITGIPPNTFSG
ncbi:MAG: hypothetical protein GYA59_07965, partial [Chloroflexi bacterium]|nr:hypothetical protein [Chloroflexota bacterium]